MRTLSKAVLFIIVSAGVARIATLLVARQFDEGSEVSDEFSRMTLMDGSEFHSRAGGLRSATVNVVLGGARIDLRNAVIDPGGATLDVENTLGGVLVVVREDWAVTVDDTLDIGGDNQVSVADPTELPDDAPQLRVRLRTRMGVSVISTSDMRSWG